MTSHLLALCFDANDPIRLARFWAGVLDWEMVDDPQDGFALLPSDDTGFRLEFFPTQEQKVGQNQTHFDLTSTSLEDQQKTVARALGLGARHIDIGQRPKVGHVVLADPEGNELCVIEPGNNFLADCGFIGAVNGDGSQEVGYFWSETLGWPSVWDQDQETAIRRASQAGRKIGGVASVDLDGAKPVSAMAQQVGREPGSRSEFESVSSKLSVAEHPRQQMIRHQVTPVSGAAISAVQEVHRLLP